MKLRKNLLREHKIYNPYELAKAAGNKIYIDYSPVQRGRLSLSASWMVIGIGFQTDPKGHFLDYGNKSFVIHGQADKQAALERAIQWANKKFGITEWEKAPFVSYQVKGTIAKIKAKIKKQN